MLHRRLFLASSIAGVSSQGFPLVAAAQDPGTIIAIAQALIKLYQSSQSDDVQAKTAAALAEIKAELDELNSKINDVLEILRALPEVMQRLLTENDAYNIEASLSGAESTTITTLISTRDGRNLSSSDRNALRGQADFLNSTRESLKSYGILTYPYVAKAFVTQALALKALRSEDAKRIFEGYQTSAADDMHAAALGFAALVVSSDQTDVTLHQKWQSHPNPYYLGHFVFMNDVKNYYGWFSGEYYSSGSSDPTHAPQGRYTYLDGSPNPDAAGFGQSPLLDYSAGNYMVDQIDHRFHDVINGLWQIAQSGQKARDNAQFYAQNRAAAARIEAAIRRMSY